MLIVYHIVLPQSMVLCNLIVCTWCDFLLGPMHWLYFSIEKEAQDNPGRFGQCDARGGHIKGGADQRAGGQIHLLTVWKYKDMNRKFKAIVRTDVLVVGGAGAGSRAALEAAGRGAGVALVNKMQYGISGATAFKGAVIGQYQAVGTNPAEGDSFGRHAADILESFNTACIRPTLPEIPIPSDLKPALS